MITPVYNVEKYLIECLDSLRKQTLEGYFDNNEIQKNTDEITTNYQEKTKRRKLFSIRINSSRVSIDLGENRLWR
ncbi:MAG: glycosyltransferase family A protein [Candidatus Gastranaerophilaceae bacterium]